MGKLNSSATITPNPYAKSYESDRETFVTRKDLMRANAELAAEILKIEEMVKAIQTQAEAAMKMSQCKTPEDARVMLDVENLKHQFADLSVQLPSLKSQIRIAQEEMPARERLIVMNQAIDQVSKHFAVPHDSKDFLADRLNAVEQTYDRLMTMVKAK